MSFKKKIENMILSRSKSYKFYKDQYEKYIKDNEKSIPQIEKEFDQLKKEFEDFKNRTDNHMDSTTYLLKNVYVDHEISQPRNALKFIQELTYELLKFTSKICEKHNIEFWLDYGSLLGAVRHQNFVPWDDDIDISMVRTNYMKFNEVIESEIKDNALDDILKVEKNPKGFTQILAKQEDNTLANLNIYAYDYLTKYNKKAFPKAYNEYKEVFKQDNDLEKYYKEMNLSLDEADYIMPGMDGVSGENEYYKTYVFKTIDVFPLKNVTFGEHTFKAPINIPWYLKRLYGDYLSLPRIIPRHDTVDKYRYNGNNEEIFGYCINKLRNLNE